MRAIYVALALALFGAFLAPSAGAGPSLFFGIAGDEPKAAGSEAIDKAKGLGARAYRITLPWEPGKTAPSDGDIAGLDTVTAAATPAGMRIIVSVYGASADGVPHPKIDTPLTDVQRDQYCTFVKSVLDGYPTIRDVVIWNEPNASFWWQPQYNADWSSAAPAAYEALLARCWDVLHDAFGDNVNVIAPATGPHGTDNPLAVSNVSHAPPTFIRKVGEAYRASGRAKPILDTIAHHPYGNFPIERPWKMHSASGNVGEGDWNRLVTAYSDAFGGTAQPYPGHCVDGKCVSIWYLEAGFQTSVAPAKANLYSGTEVTGGLVPDDVGGEPDFPTPSADSPAPDQSTQIKYALRLAYCQPYVEAFFNFLLWDEGNLTRWQSAPFWTDRTPKGSYQAFVDNIAAVDAHSITCAQPVAPASLSAKASASPRGISVTWGPGSSNIGVSGYYVYRDGAFLVRTSSLGYIDQTATPATTYTYTVRPFDAAGQTGADSTAASFALQPLLTVAKAGDGGGVVASAAPTIDCGSVCSVSTAARATVTLTATADAFSDFAGWSGACTGTDPCTVTMDGDKSVTATFTARTRETIRAQQRAQIPALVSLPLFQSVTVSTKGPGRVTSAPTGINCGKVCKSSYLQGSSVLLTAVPARGARFSGWTGSCARAGRRPRCTLAVAANAVAGANFARVCLVTKLTGKTVASARRALAASNCRLGRVTRAYSSHVRAGVVIGQRPVAGKQLAGGARVNVVVSRGRRR